MITIHFFKGSKCPKLHDPMGMACRFCPLKIQLNMDEKWVDCSMDKGMNKPLSDKEQIIKLLTKNIN